MIQILSTINLIAGIQAIFLAIVLFLKNENRWANRILSLLLFFISIEMLEHCFFTHTNNRVLIEFPWNSIPYQYIYGPLIFFYTSIMISRIEKFTIKHLIHIIPFIILFVYNLYAYFTMPIAVKINTRINTDIHTMSKAIYIINEFGSIYVLFYFCLSLYVLQKHTKKIKEFFSNIGKVSLIWLRMLIVIAIIIELLVGIDLWLTIPEIIGKNYIHWIATIIGMILIFIIAFFAYIQPEIFNKIKVMKQEIINYDILEKANDKNRSIDSEPKYEKHRLDEITEKIYLEKLLKFMETEKPYLNDSLTIKQLADALSISSHHLSMILNIHLKQNFYNFINIYRIKEITNMLSDPNNKDTNILFMAYNVGFNSKSTFNTMFKKITGLTPTEYRNKYS